jgi:hypothetical protein
VLLHRLNDVLCKSFERVFASESERVFIEPKTLGMILNERQDQFCELERGSRRNELETIAALLDLTKSRESTAITGRPSAAHALADRLERLDARGAIRRWPRK